VASQLMASRVVLSSMELVIVRHVACRMVDLVTFANNDM
jgi:hypothetical protein